MPDLTWRFALTVLALGFCFGCGFHLASYAVAWLASGVKR